VVVAYCFSSGSDGTCVWGLLAPEEIWQRWHSLSASVAWPTSLEKGWEFIRWTKANQGVSVQSFTDCLAFGHPDVSALRPWTAFEALQSLCEPSALPMDWSSNGEFFTFHTPLAGCGAHAGAMVRLRTLPLLANTSRFARYLVYDSETMRYGARWGVQALPGWHVRRGGPFPTIPRAVPRSQTLEVSGTFWPKFGTPCFTHVLQIMALKFLKLGDDLGAMAQLLARWQHAGILYTVNFGGTSLRFHLSISWEWNNSC